MHKKDDKVNKRCGEKETFIRHRAIYIWVNYINILWANYMMKRIRKDFHKQNEFRRKMTIIKEFDLVDEQ